jgi:predicted RNase H-like nuclease (RuvC/YqgF family)
MKNLLVLLILPITILIYGFKCDQASPSEKVQDAHEQATSSNKDAYKANEAFLKEVENYKEGIDKKIEDQKNLMEAYKSEVSQQKLEAQQKFAQQIEILEKRNAEMEKKLSEYKIERKEDWENFKNGMDKNMSEMDTMFENLNKLKVVNNEKN